MKNKIFLLVSCMFCLSNILNAAETTIAPFVASGRFTHEVTLAGLGDKKSVDIALVQPVTLYAIGSNQVEPTSASISSCILTGVLSYDNPNFISLNIDYMNCTFHGGKAAHGYANITGFDYQIVNIGGRNGVVLNGNVNVKSDTNTELNGK